VTISKAKRERVIAAHDGRCAICGNKPPKLTMDHKIPRSRGGTDAEGNLQPACPGCNRKKADKMPTGTAPAIYATTDSCGAVLG
jgi:5-methylcytosine-specific restriction endonuclease McrA